MKAGFFKVLKFLQVSDRGNNLSITNIALYVVLVKIAIAPTFSIEECGVLFLAVANYIHKRAEAVKSSQFEAKAVKDEYEVKIAALEAKIEATTQATEANKALVEGILKDHDKVTKQLEQTTKNLSTTNLAAGFGIKGR
jgi:hypothetical protein